MSIIKLNHAYQHTQANQSYQSSANHSHFNKNEVISSINQQPESDLGDFTLDQDGWDSLISYLEGLDVFRRIRYANEINKLNGFEVVGEVLIREWKNAVIYSHYVKIKMCCDKADYMKNEKSKSILWKSKVGSDKAGGIVNFKSVSKQREENQNMKNQKSKMDYTRAYIKLLSK